MKTKIGIALLMLMGSAQATTWLPVSPDSFSVSDNYSSEYSLPTGTINQYVWDATGETCDEARARLTQDHQEINERILGPGTYELPEWESEVCVNNKPLHAETAKQISVYNPVDLDTFYGQEGSSTTASGTLIGVLDDTGKAYVLINGSVDTGFNSEKVQIDPKVQLGGSLVYRPDSKLTLVATIMPQTILGGDINEQSCDGKSCHEQISEKRGDVVLGKAAEYEELKKALSLDYNLGATYKLLEEMEGDFIDLSGKISVSGIFKSDELYKNASLTIAKTLYDDENTKVKASLTPTHNGTSVSTGVSLAVDHRFDANSSISVGVGSNYANGDFGAISANVGINHIAEDGSEFVVGVTGNFIDGESAFVPSLSIYPEEGLGFSISPIGFGITEKYQGRKYNHSLNPYMIIIQALLGQRTILDLLTEEEVQSLSQGQSVPKEDIIFDLPVRDGLQLIYDRESLTIIGFDDDLEVALTIKVIEVGGYLFMENLSGAFDRDGELYKF